VDGNIAYLGGHNVGEEYVAGHPKLGPWRDTHVEVEGPVVRAIQFCFIEDWYWATTSVSDLSLHLRKSVNGIEETLMISSGPADPLDTCALMFN
jgi:cardiolipin synthase